MPEKSPTTGSAVGLIFSPSRAVLWFRLEVGSNKLHGTGLPLKRGSLPYSRASLDEEPDSGELRRIVNVICWNYWQMDGLTGMAPFSLIESGVKAAEQLIMFDFLPTQNTEEKDIIVPLPCRIFDWRKRVPQLYNDMKRIS